MNKMKNGLLVKVVTNPAIVLLAKDCGMDFIFYDCEHGVLPYTTLHDLMILGTCIQLPSFVRAPQLARRDVSQLLDYGATGIMVPMIETKEQALQLVEWSKYPPLGKRSYSGGANTLYGASGHHQEHMEKSNQETITIAQIETVKGVEHIEEILSVNGIDGIIVGPCDLGISMNNPDNVMDEEELRMIQLVADACERHHIPFGIIGNNTVLEQFKQQLTWWISAIDTNILREGIKASVDHYQQISGGHL